MASDYSLNYLTPGGSYIGPLLFKSFNLARRKREIGTCNIILPGDYDPLFFLSEGIFEIKRSLDNGPFEIEGETAWLVRRVRRFIDSGGKETVEITCVDFMDLLRRREIPYADDTAYAIKADYADDLMKEIVRENMLDLALDAARNLGAARLSVTPERSLGPIVTGVYSKRKLNEVFQDIANQAAEAGTEIIYDFIYESPAKVTFTTWKDYRGTNHGSDSTDKRIFSYENGNLTEPELILDYVDEHNYAYAGGSGEGSAQDVEEAEDTSLSRRGPFSRIENYTNVSETDDAAKILAAAKAFLYKGRPRLYLSGRITETQDIKFGRDVKYGDRVVGEYSGFKLNAILDTYSLQYSDAGEVVDARIHGEALIG